MIIKESPSSSCFLQTGTDYTQIAAGPNSVTVTREGGNYIQGPVSFSSPVSNIKVAGVFRFNSLLSTGIPSTMITPIPVLKLDLPIAYAGQMVGVSAMMVGLL